jgi:hypothetical protein
MPENNGFPSEEFFIRSDSRPASVGRMPRRAWQVAAVLEAWAAAAPEAPAPEKPAEDDTCS